MLAPGSAAALELAPADRRHDSRRPERVRPGRRPVADVIERRVRAVVVTCAIALVAITATSFALSSRAHFDGMATYARAARATSDTPAEIAQRRYAEGEITREQLDEVMRTLSHYRVAPGLDSPR